MCTFLVSCVLFELIFDSNMIFVFLHFILMLCEQPKNSVYVEILDQIFPVRYFMLMSLSVFYVNVIVRHINHNPMLYKYYLLNHMTVNLGLVSTRHRRSQHQSIISWLLCRSRALLFFSLSLCYAGNSGAYSALLQLNINIFLLCKNNMWRYKMKI